MPALSLAALVPAALMPHSGSNAWKDTCSATRLPIRRTPTVAATDPVLDRDADTGDCLAGRDEAEVHVAGEVACDAIWTVFMASLFPTRDRCRRVLPEDQRSEVDG